MISLLFYNVHILKYYDSRQRLEVFTLMLFLYLLSYCNQNSAQNMNYIKFKKLAEDGVALENIPCQILNY